MSDKNSDVPLWPACPEGAPLLIKLVQRASDVRYMERKLVAHRKNIEGMKRREKVIEAMLRREKARHERLARKLEKMVLGRKP